MKEFFNQLIYTPEFGPGTRLVILLVVFYTLPKLFNDLFEIVCTIFNWLVSFFKEVRRKEKYNPDYLDKYLTNDAIELDLNNLEPPYYEELDEL